MTVDFHRSFCHAVAVWWTVWRCQHFNQVLYNVRRKAVITFCVYSQLSKPRSLQAILHYSQRKNGTTLYRTLVLLLQTWPGVASLYRIPLRGWYSVSGVLSTSLLRSWPSIGCVFLSEFPSDIVRNISSPASLAFKTTVLVLIAGTWRSYRHPVLSLLSWHCHLTHKLSVFYTCMDLAVIASFRWWWLMNTFIRQKYGSWQTQRILYNKC